MAMDKSRFEHERAFMTIGYLFSSANDLSGIRLEKNDQDRVVEAICIGVRSQNQ